MRHQPPGSDRWPAADPRLLRHATYRALAKTWPSRVQTAVSTAEELAAYAFIRTWIADNVDRGMLLIEQRHVPQEAALFVLSLVKAARRALLSAEGYQWSRRWPCWITGWTTPRSGQPDESYAGAP